MLRVLLLGRWAPSRRDSAEAGADLGKPYPDGSGVPERAPVPVPAGRWRVGAVHATGESVSGGVVQLVPEQPKQPEQDAASVRRYDGDDDVPGLPPGLDIRIGVDDLLQRVPPVDDRPELSRSHQVPEVPHHLLVLLR